MLGTFARVGGVGGCFTCPTQATLRAIFGSRAKPMLSFGVASLSVSWRGLASNPLLEPPGTRRSHRHKADPSISFLTSHFSRGTPASAVSLVVDPLQEQHYKEIETAILINVFNPALAEVVVIYDSVTPADNCTHLAIRLKKRVPKVKGVFRRKESATFTCVDRLEGQPSYMAMFEYANELSFEGEVVVLGNADGAMDETIGRLAPMAPGSVVALSVTSSLDAEEAEPIHRAYETLVGPLCSPRPTSRCLRNESERRESAAQGIPFELYSWPEQLSSWDGYVFRPPLPPLSPAILPPNLTMNMMGAENRAGLALTQALNSSALIDGRLPNACGHVNWHHIHCAPKMHATEVNAAFTVPEWTSAFPGKPLPTPPRTFRLKAEDVEPSFALVMQGSGCVNLEDCLRLGVDSSDEKARSSSASDLSSDSTDAKRSRRTDGKAAEQTIVLHIGEGKAGTTYIQHLLYANAKALNASGVLYPAVDESCNEAHHFLAATACKCNPFDPKKEQPDGDDGNGIGKQSSKAWMDKLSQQLAATSGDAIISSEAFFNLPDTGIQELHELLSGFGRRIKVVLFYREKKSWLVSMFKQKSQSMQKVQWDDDLFGRQLELHSGLIQIFRQHLDSFIDAFGRENVVLLDYAGLVKSGMDPAAALLEAGELPTVKFDKPPDYDNPSIDDHELAVRQLWHLFEEAAQELGGCNRLDFDKIDATGYYQANFSALPLAAHDLPMRCTNLSVHDEAAVQADSLIRVVYSDLMLKASPSAALESIRRSDVLCELDEQAVRDDPDTWHPRFKDQLDSLPDGACVSDEQDEQGEEDGGETQARRHASSALARR